MRIDIPEEKLLVHETTIPIAWGDMDALGHVNNAVYFRYMEMARVDWMRSIGAEPDPHGEGPVIVNTFCNFLVPLVYPGDVLTRFYVGRPGRTSFDTYVTMARADDPERLCAAGGATIVWTDMREQRSAALPHELRLRLGYSGEAGG